MRRAPPANKPERAKIATCRSYLIREMATLRQLRVVLELPTETVASWMGRSPGAVRGLLHRALRELHQNPNKDGT